MKRKEIIKDNMVFERISGFLVFKRLLNGNFPLNNSGYHNKYIKRG
jgi:hypothetical protein